MDNIHSFTIPYHIFKNKEHFYRLVHSFSEDKKTLLVFSLDQSKQSHQFIVVDHLKDSISEVKSILPPHFIKMSQKFSDRKIFFYNSDLIIYLVDESKEITILCIDLFVAAYKKENAWFSVKTGIYSELFKVIVSHSEKNKLPLLISCLGLKRFIKFYCHPGEKLQYYSEEYALPLSQEWPSVEKYSLFSCSVSTALFPSLLFSSPLNYIFSDKYNLLVKTKTLTNQISKESVFFIEIKDYNDDKKGINAWEIKGIDHYAYLPQAKAKDVLYFQTSQYWDKKKALVIVSLKTQSVYQYSKGQADCEKLLPFSYHENNVVKEKSEIDLPSECYIIQHGPFFIDLIQGYTALHENFFKLNVEKEIPFSENDIYSNPFGPYFKKVGSKVKMAFYDHYFFPLLVNGYMRRYCKLMVDSICKVVLTFTYHTHFKASIVKQPTQSEVLKEDIQEIPLNLKDAVGQKKGLSYSSVSFNCSD